MSNLIKYTFVNFDKEDSYVIDYEKKEKPVEEPELQMTQVPDPEGFEAGVPVKNFDQVWEEKQEEATSDIDGETGSEQAESMPASTHPKTGDPYQPLLWLFMLPGSMLAVGWLRSRM